MDDAVRAIERPHRNLLRYYILTSLLLGPLFPLLLVPRYFRYHTLRYTFGAEGIAMRWGVLFRREIHLTYARIQDIHLRSNFVERWLGLGRLLIQTASGSSGAEMTIEGVREFETLRDFIYDRMRGARETDPTGPPPGAPEAGRGDLAGVLEDVADELRRIRELLGARDGNA